MSNLYIRDNHTGEIRLSKWQDTSSQFWWTEGNAGCDCNRAIAFGIDDRDISCGEDRFSLVNEDGTEYVDWPEEDVT